MKAVEWISNRLKLLDQTELPNKEVYIEHSDYRQVVESIKKMRLRGAPAIGIAAAFGLVLGAQGIQAKSVDEFLSRLQLVSEQLAATRPTAVNLFWALDRMNKVVTGLKDVASIKQRLLTEALSMDAEGKQANRNIGTHGAKLIENGFTILTHCNAGALATEGYGTALGVIRSARDQGKAVYVYSDETRPLLQGARLTAWELMQDGIPVTLITDNMAGYFLNSGKIDCVIVGADRIAANGDVANKIGTYSVAVLAMENAVPFYVAAPTSTIDISLVSGREIPIEERNSDEITHIQGVRIAPEGVQVANPAFDVTPHNYITAIITEKGVVREPYSINLPKIVS